MINSGRLAWSGQSPYLPIRPGGPDEFIAGDTHQPYPPTFFILMAPWIATSGPLRDVSWLLLQEAALVGIVVAVYAGLGRPTRNEAVLALAMVLAFLPVRQNLFEGQFNVLLTLLAVLALLAYQRRRAGLGGTALAFSVALKPTAVLLLPYFLWRRAGRLVTWSLAVLAVLAAVTVSLGWGHLWPAFLELLGPLGRGTAMVANQSVNGVLLRIWRPELSGEPIGPLPLPFTAIWYGLDLLLLGAMVLTMRRLSLPGRERAWTEFAILLLVLPALQPLAWFHHYTGAAVAIMVGLRLARERLLDTWPLVGLIAAYVVASFVAYPLHLVARPIGGLHLADYPLLRVGTSTTFVAVLLALFCLGRARPRIPDC